MLAYLLVGSPFTIYKRLDSSSPKRGIASLRFAPRSREDSAGDEELGTEPASIMFDQHLYRHYTYIYIYNIYDNII